MTDTTGLTKDKLSYCELLKAFPTRQDRIDMIKTCVQNIWKTSEIEITNEYQREAITEYRLLMHLVAKRLYDINLRVL